MAGNRKSPFGFTAKPQIGPPDEDVCRQAKTHSLPLLPPLSTLEKHFRILCYSSILHIFCLFTNPRCSLTVFDRGRSITGFSNTINISGVYTKRDPRRSVWPLKSSKTFISPTTTTLDLFLVLGSSSLFFFSRVNQRDFS